MQRRKPLTLALIVGTRGFFPSHLAESGRTIMIRALEQAGVKVVIPPFGATRSGAVESLEETHVFAEYFRQRADQIDGVLVSLPNFGDERAIANVIRWSGLKVPVLVQAFPDDPAKMTNADRRDSFCGKMSACNNLRQYGIRYSLTTNHTVDPESSAFQNDLARFAAICRIVGALKAVRIGAIGTRPAAFNTVRYSEQLLERSGISVETLDLSELLGWIKRMKDSERAVRRKLEAIRQYTNVQGVPSDSLIKMAKFGLAIDRWMADKELVATAIQCWTALEEFYGVVPCTIMSMMSNNLLPSACETDIAGLVGMLVLQSASGGPAALLDWNNNHGANPDKGVVFHCSNLPKSFFTEHQMDYQAIIAGTVGRENTYGTIVGSVAAGSFTYCRVGTDDNNGQIRAYVGQGDFTGEKLNTFGGYGVISVLRFQELLQFICREGFEHHVAATKALVADAVDEALTVYKGWNVYHHC